MGAAIEMIGQILGWVVILFAPIGAWIVVVVNSRKTSAIDFVWLCTATILTFLTMFCVAVKGYQIGDSVCVKAYLAGYDQCQKDWLEGR